MSPAPERSDLARVRRQAEQAEARALAARQQARAHWEQECREPLQLPRWAAQRCPAQAVGLGLALFAETNRVHLGSVGVMLAWLHGEQTVMDLRALGSRAYGIWNASLRDDRLMPATDSFLSWKLCAAADGLVGAATDFVEVVITESWPRLAEISRRDWVLDMAARELQAMRPPAWTLPQLFPFELADVGPFPERWSPVLRGHQEHVHCAFTGTHLLRFYSDRTQVIPVVGRHCTFEQMVLGDALSEGRHEGPVVEKLLCAAAPPNP